MVVLAATWAFQGLAMTSFNAEAFAVLAVVDNEGFFFIERNSPFGRRCLRHGSLG